LNTSTLPRAASGLLRQRASRLPPSLLSRTAMSAQGRASSAWAAPLLLLALAHQSSAEPLCGPLDELVRTRSGVPDTLIPMIASAKVGGAPLAPDVSAYITLPPARGAVTVGAHMEVMRIWAINQKLQSFKIKFQLVLEWRDCRLQWADTGPSKLIINDENEYFSKFWHPRTEVEEQESSVLGMARQEFMWFPHGGVVNTQLHGADLHCAFDFSELPFDVHNCSVTIVIPQYTSNELDLRWDHKPGEGPEVAVSTAALSNSEWDFNDISEWTVENVNITHDRGSLQLVHAAIRLTFTITRKSQYQIQSQVVPSVIYWLLSYAGLWVEASAVPGRAALGALPVLMLANKINAVKASMPPIAYSTRLDRFMTATLILAGLIMLEFCVVNSCSRLAKSMAGEEAKAKAALEDGGDGAASAKRTDTWRWRALHRTAALGRDWLDVHSRWVFLLTFVIVILVTVVL